MYVSASSKPFGQNELDGAIQARQAYIWPGVIKGGTFPPFSIPLLPDDNQSFPLNLLSPTPPPPTQIAKLASYDMSGYKTVAVAGSGNIGNFIIEELLKAGATVTVLSRKPDTEVPQGASVKAVDYNNADQLAEALSGQDVVVSTLSQGGFAVQGALADASKKAGVKLFVPS